MNEDILNMLSDSTFSDKLDEQNAILEDIRDNIGGGGSDLKAAAVRSDTPDSQGVSQLYKLDGQGNRTNVYPAGALRWVVPKIPGEASINDDVFVSANDYSIQTPTISQDYQTYGNFIQLNSDNHIWIKNTAFGITSSEDAVKLITPIFTSFQILNNNRIVFSTVQATTYTGYTVITARLTGSTTTSLTLKLLYG